MDKEKLYINSFCQISNQEVCLNDELIFRSIESDFNVFAKEIYQKFEIQYPKFHKMDALCKLAFLSSEFVLNQNYNPETAIILANHSSSLDTDVKHQKTIQNQENYFPSPAVFVYTLPNITIGEISIRHQLKSESAFFVDENYPIELIHQQAEYLIKSGKTTQVLCGWTEYFQNNYQAFVYLVGKEGNVPLESKFIKERIINK